LENTNAYTPTPEEVCNGFVIFLIIFSSLWIIEANIKPTQKND
jgi:hypothetical protein